MTRDEIVGLIGSIIDHPSVYMGGASQQSMRKAERILEALAASGYAVVPVEATEKIENAIREAFKREWIFNARAVWRDGVAAAQEDSHE